MKRTLFGLLFSALAVTFLAGCENKEAKTYYTITINDVDHFHPSSSKVTFAEDDFKPINISYNVDNDYFVTETKVDGSELSECSFDEANKKLIITPKENIDFSVTVSVTKTDTRTAILITSDNDDHFYPETKTTSHAYNDPDPVVIPYSVDNHCSVSGVTVTPAGAADCSFDNNKLTIMPRGFTLSITIHVSITTECKEINFVCDSEKGEELWPGAESTLEIPYFSEWGEKIDLRTQRATYEFFDFVGGAFDKKEVIPNDYVINDDTPTTVYPVFIYDVDISGESLEVHDVFIDEETDNLNIYLRLKNRDKYEYPTSKDKFTITNGFTTPVDNFEIEYSPDDDILAIVIPSSEFEILEQGVVSILVTDYQPEYDVAFIGEPNQHLSFPGLEEKKAKKGA